MPQRRPTLLAIPAAVRDVRKPEMRTTDNLSRLSRNRTTTITPIARIRIEKRLNL
jgi:hypothetical protein